ncbi:choice-of-anchor D domain-containing protein [Seonamhaeicola sediminis]|uniref:Choice-of-anchor D domain-containing protein n=1 Tax=Seonamhaeicola sediminis TaxID=2528206 RepID=A0A562Y996_9FLAO|nr:choice-of-anchor D domain-containing protein [Seonamhaeicola sediminis]TWO30669.1 choice-of-anchor D domain-containing protein [Seonamhaeicola sediminis]
MKKITYVITCLMLFVFCLKGNSQNQDINIQGNSIDITNGDITPIPADNTDFGSVGTGSSVVHTFEIQNTATGSGNPANNRLTINSISVSNTTDFTLTNTITTINRENFDTFTITFNPTVTGLITAIVTITSDDPDEGTWTYTIQGTGTVPSPEIDLQGNGTSIASGDTTPDVADDTDFGQIDISGGTVVNTFTIQNLGAADLNLTGTGPTYITITGTDAADFSVTANPTTPIAASGNTSFDITFDPSTCGVKTATVTIANDDADENPYTFDIQGEGTAAVTGSQDINVTGNAIDIPNGDTTPQVADETDFGSLNVGFSNVNTFEIHNTHSGGSPGSNQLTISSITVSGAHAGDFSVTSAITTINRDGSETFTITFMPSALGLRTATVTIVNNSSVCSEQPYVFDIQGTGTPPSPEIDVFDDANNPISDGSTDSPASINQTLFGSTDALTPISTTYTIENNGSLTLNISSVTSDNADFAVTVPPASTVTTGGSTTFTITFTPSAVGIITGTITIVNDDSDENPYTFTVQGEGTAAPPEYTAYYENFDIDDGGWTIITSTGDTWLWTNTFPATAIELAEGGFWRCSTYDNYLSNTNIVVESPQLDFTGLQNLRVSLDVKYKTESGNDGLRIMYSVAGGPYTLLGASGSGTNWYEGNVNALGSDGWSNNSHPTNTAFTHNKFINANVTLSDATFANQNNVKFRIEFSSNGSGTDDGVAFDNFRVEADPSTALSDSSIAPANITSNLRLWLKANEGISATDGTAVTSWEDQAYDVTLDKEDANADSNIAPTYRDNATRNMNYNPVLDFDNNNVQYMNGKGGFYATDYFAVFRSDDIVDTQTGSFSPGRQFAVGGRYSRDNFHEDPTGLGMGSTSARFTDEILSHNLNSFPNGSSAPNDDSYGRAYTTNTETYQNHVLIVNVKSNATRTSTEIYKNGKRVDNTTGTAGNGADLNFKEFNNIPVLVGTGRSGLAGRTTSQLNGMLTEIISYTSPNSAINQQKIQSYLGVKYGVTLQSSSSTATSYRENDVDYIDSQGNVIWDTATNSSYNFDVAGIGRDDASVLDQRQSRSQNDEADIDGPTSGFLTMALTQTYTTNKENIANTSGLSDRQFLMWGNNNADINGSAINVTVDMSEDITGVKPTTNVSFTAIPRIWKVVENANGGDIPEVEVSIPVSAVRTAAPPDGRYLMFISATGVFDPTADYRVMTESGGNLYAKYDFDNTEYITFGWAPEETFERSIFFDPANGHYVDVEDNLDLSPTNFTISAWIKRGTNSTNKSIVSKRDVSFTEGYDFKITSTGHVEMTWQNGGAQTITSDVVIPEDEWHQVAVIYDGTTATLYIDGVQEKTATLLPPTDTAQSFFIAAAGKLAPTAFFHGNIDEVRVWDTALTVDQLRYIMNQEITDNSLNVGPGYFISRSVSPTKDETSSIPWSSLAGYYPMSTYTYTNTKDESGNGHQGALKNLKTVDWQTAPLPYISTQDGDWTTNTTWTNGDVQTIPGATALADNSVTVDWNIVRTAHNITIDNSTLPAGNNGNRSVLGLFVDANELTLDGDNSTGTGNGLTVTHYLKLDGNIDLEGESQLIQSEDSDLDVTSSGTIEKDQQGTKDLFTYNYWSSPVGRSNTTTNNNSYTASEMLRDGLVPSNPLSINFTGSGYNGAPGVANTTGATIADYWIWKYANRTGNTYSEWQHMRSSGTIYAGEGFTMKGVENTGGAITQTQNYVFNGKPNNGDITLTVTAGNDYLVGNPYPSALDADEFILDNIADSGGRNSVNVINGAVYFWDHFARSTHVLKDYAGGYATYSLMGGLPAVNNDTRISATGEVGTKVPNRYIPVSQGFFVVARDTGASNTVVPVGGDILFKNSQRVFEKESGGNSNFLKSGNSKAKSVTSKSNTDTRQKIRLMFDSPEGYHRQILVGVDTNASDGFDIGYDAPLNETNIEDMYWTMSNGDKLVIQAVSNFNDNKTLPLALKTNIDGISTIRIEALENILANKSIFIRDKVLDINHNLKEGAYEVFLSAGQYVDRFEITFMSESSLGLDNIKDDRLNFYFSNEKQSIILHNPKLKDIKSIDIFNILGQSVTRFSKIGKANHMELKTHNLKPGTYIIKTETIEGTLSKKVLIH